MTSPALHTRPEQPEDAAALLALAAQCLGPPQCRWLEMLRRSPDFLPHLSLTLWDEKHVLACAMLASLPLYVARQRVQAVIAAPVLLRPGLPPGTGGQLLGQLMHRAAAAGLGLLALPLEPSYHRHAGFVPPQTQGARGPFDPGIAFVLKGLSPGMEALAQSLTPHCIIYAHAERLP